MQFYDFFEHLKTNTDGIIFGFLRNFVGNVILFGLKFRMWINDVSMAWMFENWTYILVTEMCARE